MMNASRPGHVQLQSIGQRLASIRLPQSAGAVSDTLPPLVPEPIGACGDQRPDPAVGSRNLVVRAGRARDAGPVSAARDGWIVGRVTRLQQHPWLRRLALFGARLRRFARGKTGRAVAAALLTLLLLTGLRAYNPWIVTELKERTFDAYQRLKPRAYADLPVRIVDIDEASIAAFGQWPWPRTRLAALTKRLGELGAGVVAFDVIFAEPDRTTPKRIAADLQRYPTAPNREQAVALLEKPAGSRPAVRRCDGEAPQRVLGFAASRLAQRHPAGRSRPGSPSSASSRPRCCRRSAARSSNLPLLDDAAAGVGGINLSARDRSGVIRRMPMLFSDGDADLSQPRRSRRCGWRRARRASSCAAPAPAARPTAATPRCSTCASAQFKMPLTDDGEAWIYYDHDRPERYVSVKDLLDPAKDAAVRAADRRLDRAGRHLAPPACSTHAPRRSAQTVPGVAIHAQLIEQILGAGFHRPPGLGERPGDHPHDRAAALIVAVMLPLVRRAVLADRRHRRAGRRGGGLVVSRSRISAC